MKPQAHNSGERRHRKVLGKYGGWQRPTAGNGRRGQAGQACTGPQRCSEITPPFRAWIAPHFQVAVLTPFSRRSPKVDEIESPFNREERAAGGELVSRIWVADQKLAKGVEIPAELWSLIGQQPGSTMMIIAGDEHAPCALTGQELLELKDSRQITLHPARYRIVETNSD